LPYSAVRALQDALGLSFGQLAEMLRVSPRTLERRKVGGSLDAVTSDRALRLSRLYSLVLDLFEGDVEGSREWLKEKNAALDGLFLPRP